MFETEAWYFWGNMKVLFGDLDWELGPKGSHSDEDGKTFLGLYIVSNVLKWSMFLLKMRWKFLSLAPVLFSSNAFFKKKKKRRS